MTRRHASLATLAVVAALLLGTSGPAAAAEELTVTIISPPDGEVLTDPNAVIAGTATTDVLHVLKGVRVTVTSRLNAENHGSCDAPVAPDGSFSCSPGFRFNGPYEAVVTATDALHLDLGDMRTREATRGFKMEAPPAPPQGVTVDVGPDRRATISWVRNTEPDLRHYVVTRVAPGGGTSPVGFVPQPPSGERVSLVDGSLPPTGGKYEYIVAAVRSDRDGQATNNRAVARSSPVTVEVAAAPTAGAGPPGPGLPAPRARGGSNVSSFLSGGGVPTSLALPDGASLPLDGGSSSGQPFALPGGDGSESADPAVLEGGASASNQRALVVPIAAALLLCVLAFHLRQFDRAVLSAPPAYHPILESDSDSGDGRELGDDDHADSRTVLVGAGRRRGEG